MTLLTQSRRRFSRAAPKALVVLEEGTYAQRSNVYGRSEFRRKGHNAKFAPCPCLRSSDCAYTLRRRSLTAVAGIGTVALFANRSARS